MASESSNSSSTSQHPNENKQNQLPNSDSNKSIDFVNLSKDDLVRGSKVKEHNFFSPDQVGSSSSRKFYSCSYCKGQYSSLQALGGHQNAHKAERALQMQRIKQRYEGGAFNLGQPCFNPYLNYPVTHFAPYNYRPLGVRIESMIQKSPYFSPRIGLGALGLHDILNPSLVSFKNNIVGSSSSRVASLGIGGGATTSRTEDEVGYTNNGTGAIPKIGESSANNVAPIVEEEPSDSDSDSSGLDLSLKL